MLPNGTEPLQLADGTLINPETGSPVQEEVLVEVPNTVDMRREIVAARMRLADLPVPPQQMNTLSIILSYSLQGISDDDIGLALNVDLETITNIKATEAYADLQAVIVENITKSDMSTVREMFVQQSRKAADTMFSLLDSESETVKGGAAKDVLDRAGQRPVDVVEHRLSLEGGLTIEYVDRASETKIPLIDITPKKEDF